MTSTYLGASPRAIQRHYDVGNDFYALWLDAKTFCYSCAMWEPGDTLEAAQLRKYEWHIAQARAHEASQVLDIGCGWGGLSRMLVDEHGVGHVVSLTLSKAQADYIRALNHPKIDARLEGWADHQPTGSYDAILAVGVLEHAARLGLSSHQKINAYRTFFQRCHRMLKPGRWMSGQTIIFENVGRMERILGPTLWRWWPGGAQALLSFSRRVPLVRTQLAGLMRRVGELQNGFDPYDVFEIVEVFEESTLPRIAEFSEAVEGFFEIEIIRNDREQYRQTTQAWYDRLQARRKEAVAIVGEATTAHYEHYLLACTRIFEAKACGLMRFVLRRL
ncbi:MAG: class I SAM-dependent methyltransferase [Candidatus Omnitrophica bacterium]|nr:class I SAM-dependent methyltransferase [Candidatus Omnitrophota bacterium]